MTKRNKLIVGAVVVLGVLFLLDRNKKMKAVAELKAQAERGKNEKALATKRPMNTVGLNTMTEII
jgi:hypothetical protein